MAPLPEVVDPGAGEPMLAVTSHDGRDSRVEDLGDQPGLRIVVLPPAGVQVVAGDREVEHRSVLGQPGQQRDPAEGSVRPASPRPSALRSWALITSAGTEVLTWNIRHSRSSAADA